MLIRPLCQTDLTPGVPNIYTKRKYRPQTGPNSQANGANSNSHPSHILPVPPRRQGSMRPHCNTRRSTRQDSFTPELEAIPSEENSQEDSDEEGTPSLSGSFGSSEDSMMRIQLARTRESCDDRFSGYLLALAAKAAEKQLREQALAAFPNETMHETVEHYYDREREGGSDDGSVEGVGLLIMDEPEIKDMRRKPTEVGWAAREMQEHQEKLHRLREAETNHKVAAEATKPTFKDPFWTNGMSVKAPVGQTPEDKQKKAELARMRTAASPPMLGADLKFRMCPSPKATKFESDQRIDVEPNRSDNGGGLWGGYCVAEEAGEYLSPALERGPAMIQTPYVEKADPFASAFFNELPADAKPKGSSRLLPDGGVRMLAGIDERLKAEVARSKQEETLLAEFDDTFVTQVYNYLSLGYPALARAFDEELARISRVKVDELRKSDKKVTPGYIGVVDRSAGTPEQHGERWKALRIYIMEWGRQHPSMSNGAMGPQAWGVRARRGSWAI